MKYIYLIIPKLREIRALNQSRASIQNVDKLLEYQQIYTNETTAGIEHHQTQAKEAYLHFSSVPYLIQKKASHKALGYS